MVSDMKLDFKNYKYTGAPHPPRPNTADAYREFDATELYCPRCKQAVAVRKRLLLVLPEGDKYEYRCAVCATSVGIKIDRQVKPISLIV